MRKTVIALVAGLLALVWLTAGTARAKGITTARITISGPEMTRTLAPARLGITRNLNGRGTASPPRRLLCYC